MSQVALNAVPRLIFLPLVCLFGLGASSLCCGQQLAELPAEREQFHLFLLIGQSNMAGRGVVEPEDTQPHPRVWMLDQQERWVPAVDPLHFDKPKVVGVGPSRSFALSYAEAHPDVTVGLIPCAVGGSPIDAWRTGEFYVPTNSHPYDDALRRAKTAQQYGVLRGMLWHQGESDSQAGLAENYERKLIDLAKRLRSELHVPQAYFLIGQMGQFAERPWDTHRRQVDIAHRQAAEKIPLAAFVSSDGLQHKGDEVHFDAPSARELGRRYFLALQSLEKHSVDELKVEP